MIRFASFSLSIESFILAYLRLFGKRWNIQLASQLDRNPYPIGQ